MLYIEQKSKLSLGRLTIGSIAGLLCLTAAYAAIVIFSPAFGPFTLMKPISVSALSSPSSADNRLIIPRIGINIPYANGSIALDRGAEWKHPESGNPENGGSFVIAAPRLNIQPTPEATILKSPFYNLGQLQVKDKIIVDYNGKRYGYEVQQVTTNQNGTGMNTNSNDASMTLYSSDLNGAPNGGVAVIAHPLGLIATNPDSSSR